MAPPGAPVVGYGPAWPPTGPPPPAVPPSWPPAPPAPAPPPASPVGEPKLGPPPSCSAALWLNPPKPPLAADPALAPGLDPAPPLPAPPRPVPPLPVPTPRPDLPLPTPPPDAEPNPGTLAGSNDVSGSSPLNLRGMAAASATCLSRAILTVLFSDSASAGSGSPKASRLSSRDQLVAELVVPGLEGRPGRAVGDHAAGPHDEQRIGLAGLCIDAIADAREWSAGPRRADCPVPCGPLKSSGRKTMPSG